MDGLRPTLPLLLDLNSSPSYHNPKTANGPNRPATTNLGRTTSNHSTAQNFTKRSKKSSATAHPRTPFKTTTGFYNHDKKQAEVEDFQTFRFTEFQSLQKTLPRLYTPSQYQAASQKLNNLRERYQHLYVKPEGTEGDLPQDLAQENLKELVLEAEKVFNATYSVKYFGVKDNTLGIVSKRVPMNNNITDKQQEKTKNSTAKGGSAGRKQRFCQEKKAQADRTRMMSLTNPNKNSQLSWGLGAWKEGGNTSSKGRVEGPEGDAKISSEPGDGLNTPIKESHSRNNSGGASGAKERAATASSNMRVSYPQKHDEVKNFEEDDGRINEEEAVNEENNGEEFNESYYYEQLAREAQERAQIEANQEGARYVVTKYFVPKKLQAVKKKPEEDSKGPRRTPKILEVKGNVDKRNTESSQGHGDMFGAMGGQENRERIWQKVVVADQTASNNADFERKLMSLGKVKRSLLRNVRVEKAWENRPYKDELDVQEKFRTHEVQKVMADNAKYSYAKLLETMQTNERPETALISNTEKMEKILSIRKEKKRLIASRGGDNEEFDVVENEKRGANGRYMVKVWYPKENEMFNRFVKIRANMDGTEQVVN